MGTFAKSRKTIEIEQQCRYGFTEEYVEKLCNEWSSIKDYAWILHNRCKKEDGTDKEPHIHLMIRFKDSVPTTAILSKLKGVCELENLEKIKSWNSAIAYLTHANKPEKTQYRDDEVHSNYEWKEDRDKAIQPHVRLAQLSQGILDGSIKRYNLFEYLTIDEYDKYKRNIDNFFAYKDMLNFNEVNRNMEVVYIYGESESGKTTYAKKVASDRGMSVFISSSGSDFLDGYGGQECIILDDFRGSQAPLNTILKLLDHNTASNVASRYRNKSISECRLIIITSVQSVEELFRSAFAESVEPLAQFKRRCKIVMHFTQEKIETMLYNDGLGTYTVVATVPNIVLDEIKKDFKPENQMEYIASVLGGTSDLLKAMKEEVLRDKDLQFDDVDDVIEGQQTIPF